MSDTPASQSPQQIEAARFRSAVSEALAQSLQANINFLLKAALPVGSIVASMLSEADFQDEINSTNWVLCNGQDVSASNYAALTGFTLAPDLRGRYQRMRDYGVGRDAAGDLALGDTYNATFEDHVHTLADHAHDVTSNPGGTQALKIVTGTGGTNGIVRGNGVDTNTVLTTLGPNVPNTSLAQSGQGAETRVDSLIINYFIRIN